TDRLGPPLDITLDSLNCTAFSIQWRMPRQHASTITGYTVSTDLSMSFQSPSPCPGQQISLYAQAMAKQVKKVYYAEVKADKPIRQQSHDVPLSLDMLSMVSI
ncbi:hypothetical protein JD844_008451, partial [Phrynosoma platyrhinos]